MKKFLRNFTRTTLAIAALGLMVSVASAQNWIGPGGTFPQGNVAAPVNTGAFAQTKASSFTVTAPGGANLSANGNVNGLRGFFSAVVNSPRARLGCFLLSCSNATITSNDTLQAGKYTSGSITQGIVAAENGNVSIGKVVLGSALPTQGLFVGNILNQAMSVFFGKVGISLSGTGPTGRNALDITVSQDNISNGDGAVFSTNADRFSFYNNTTLAALSAKKIRLTEGAAAGKVLTSDADGNASWGDATGLSTVDMIEVHQSYNPSQGTESKTVSCPASHPIAVSAGGGCRNGMISKVNVSFLGNEGSQGNATVTCRLQDGQIQAPGKVDGVDLICAKAVAGGVYGGSVANGSGGAPTVGWHPLASAPNGPTTVAANGTSCMQWLAGGTYASSLKRGQGVINVGVPITLGTNPDAQGGSESCVYQFTSQTYQSGGSAGGAQNSPTPGMNSIKSSCIYAAPTATYANAKPVKTCTDPAAVLDFSGTGGTITTGSYTANTEVKY